MPFQFSANIGLMFPEVSYVPLRYQAAKDAGFKAVETWDLFDFSIQELSNAKNSANIQQIMMNTPTGDFKGKGEFGVAALPGREKDFITSLELGIKYCKSLECKMLHILAGNPVGEDFEEIKRVYKKNLLTATKRCEQEGIVGLIEPISKIQRPQYHMNDVDYASDLVKEINSPAMKIELDIFHLQLSSGNLCNKIREIFPLIGHIQIAQAPDRHEPNTPGEINYRFIFDVLSHLGYNGWIGLEYIPRGNTVEGLSWLKEFGYTL